MSEFQLSLLTIGLVVVIGVYLYGFWQQMRYRRSQGEASKSQSTQRSGQAATIGVRAMDARLDDESDPLLGLEGVFSNSAVDEICSLLNDATDYVATFPLKTPQTPHALEALWQRRFDFGKSVHACGLHTGNGLWERLIPESEQTYRAFRIGMQLVDRAGSVSEMRLAGFRDLLHDIAAQLQIEVKLPLVEEAVRRAQELDRFCADVDQMIGINLLTSGDQKAIRHGGGERCGTTRNVLAGRWYLPFAG